jgi:outer membrane protein assembly factor BamB
MGSRLGPRHYGSAAFLAIGPARQLAAMAIPLVSWPSHLVQMAGFRAAAGALTSEPLNKRHIKSTYASSSPATDGRVVVAWFGSQGVYAYDLDGTLRWKVDLGRVDMGAYNLPTFEWEPASSPIIWNGLVILECDTQADSFVLALNAETGKTVWKTERKELPSWGTPTVAIDPLA